MVGVILEYLKALNNSKFFAGLVMIMLNIGSKYVTIELSKNQEQYLKNNIGRQILVFAISWMGSRDILVALALTAIFTVFIAASWWVLNNILTNKSKVVLLEQKTDMIIKLIEEMREDQKEMRRDVQQLMKK